MSETTFPTLVPCPGCGQPAEQEWCDVTGLDMVPQVVPGERTCFTEDCAVRIRRQAELDHIAATGHVWVPARRPWWRVFRR